jgi:flagellin
MGLRIQNNIAAMNAHRQLGIADSAMGKSLQRLSSGYRINSSADDAAGLAISQGFRADIAAFKVASRNMSEATSMLQVAEGAMDQLDNMLIRLKELATQSASDNVTLNERTKIDAESDKIIAEMQRIADSTKYGSSKLIDGSFGGLSGSTAPGTVTADYSATLNAAQDLIYKHTEGGAATDAMTITVASDAVTKEGVWTLATTSGASVMALSNGSVTATATGDAGVFDFSEIGITLSTTDNGQTNEMHSDLITIAKTGIDTSAFSVGSDATAQEYTITEASGNITLTGADGSTQSKTSLATGTAATVDFDSLGITLSLSSDYDTGQANLNGMTFTVSNSAAKEFQIGADNDAYNRLEVTINDTSTGTNGLALTGVDLTDQTNARTALGLIDTAIDTLATRRADIGGYQNRLSYATANIASTIENTQAAESVIRDVDMASEMTNFTKNQILLQAGTAMLAQANMAPQQVLSLFG